MFTKEELQDLEDKWHVSKIIRSTLTNLDDPVIVIVGAFSGKVMNYFYDLSLKGRIIGYEPQDWAAAKIGEGLPDCEIHPYALGVQTCTNLVMNE